VYHARPLTGLDRWLSRRVKPSPIHHPLPAAGLRIAYERHPAHSALLAADDTLAVIGFGPTAALPEDPRCLRVGLRPLADAAPYEVWRTAGRVRFGRAGAVGWAADEQYLFGALEIDEAAHGGILAATEAAYATLRGFTATSTHPHLLRIWNYLAAINEGEGDAERYRQFCTGRSLGMPGVAGAFPAASAIGRSDGVHVLQVYWLAARTPGEPIENPRQTSAWRYPRQYGPTAPTFARAMRVAGPPARLYVSGTAAVVGHASLHPDDAIAQLGESFANLESLFASAHMPAGLGADSLLKIYVRRATDAPALAAMLDRHLAREVPRLLLLGDICRRELLVEIDGLHAG